MTSKNSILSAISQHEPTPLKETAITSAVMVILLEQQNEFSIVLTKRISTISYGGDYSFPGGMRDIQDKDLLETAKREVYEELGLLANAYQIIGQLDDFQDRFGNLVRPFVAYMNKHDFETTYHASSDEIEKIYYFFLDKLNEFKDNANLAFITRRSPSYSFTEGDVFVWGLTASILVHLFNIITNKRKPLGKLTK